jgi:hypothetical protein
MTRKPYLALPSPENVIESGRPVAHDDRLIRDAGVHRAFGPGLAPVSAYDALRAGRAGRLWIESDGPDASCFHFAATGKIARGPTSPSNQKEGLQC